MTAWILALTVKATLLLAGIGAIALLVRRSAAATRHFVWTSGFALLLLLPLLAWILPSWSPGWVGERVPAYLVAPLDDGFSAPLRLARTGSEQAVEATVAEGSGDGVAPAAGEAIAASRTSDERPAVAAAAGPSPAGSLAPWLLGVWLFGWLATATWLVVGLVRRAGLARSATRLRHGPIVGAEREAAGLLGLRRRVDVLIGAARFVPMTWGIARPVLYLPADARRWTPQRLRTVLLHELAHIKRNDSLCRSLAQVACSIFWFHPLAWMAARRMLCEQERACDDVVILAGADPHDYAATLLQMARELRSPRPLAVGALAFSRRSNLERRLLSILDPLGSRKKMSTFRKALVAGLFVVAVLPLAALRPVAAQQEDAQQIKVQASGAIRIPADVDSITLEPGGRVTVTQGDRELVVRARDDGELVFEYTVGGAQRPFDDDARRWANGVLENARDLGRLPGPFIATFGGVDSLVQLEPVELELIEPLELELIEPLEIEFNETVELATLEPLEIAFDKTFEMVHLEPLEIEFSKTVELATLKPVEIEFIEPLELASLEPLEVELADLDMALDPLELTLRGLDEDLVSLPSIPRPIADFYKLEGAEQVSIQLLGTFDTINGWSEGGSRFAVMRRGTVELGGDIDEIRVGGDGELFVVEGTADEVRRLLHVYSGEGGELVFDWFVEGERATFDDDARAWLRPLLERLR